MAHTHIQYLDDTHRRLGVEVYAYARSNNSLKYLTSL